MLVRVESVQLNRTVWNESVSFSIYGFLQEMFSFPPQESGKLLGIISTDYCSSMFANLFFFIKIVLLLNQFSSFLGVAVYQMQRIQEPLLLAQLWPVGKSLLICLLSVKISCQTTVQLHSYLAFLSQILIIRASQ